MKRLTLTVVAAMMAAVGWADGGFAYQGSLYTADGAAVATKSVAVVFRLYDGESASTALWARKINVRTDADGFFNVDIDDSQGVWVGAGVTNTVANVLRVTAQNKKSAYLGLTVEGSRGEILPRQRVQAVPLVSFAADSLESADDTFTVGGSLTLHGESTFNGDATFEDTATFQQAVTVGQQALVTNAVCAESTSIGVGACYVMPTNTIILWWGEASRVPAGWVICDGNNGTPDLRGRFPLGGGTGANDHKKGTNGGSATVTLTVDQIPSHSHQFANDVNVGNVSGYPEKGTHGERKGYRNDSENNLWYYHTSSVGGSQPHNNMPPYLAVHFIMRVK